MDARALAAAAGTRAATLNTWLHKGYFPDTPAGGPGRGQGRNFDIPTAVRAGLMMEMLRLQISPDFAAAFSDPRARGENKIALLFTHMLEQSIPREWGRAEEQIRVLLRLAPKVVFLPNKEKLAEYLAEHGADMPPTYTVIDIGKIEATMRLAEEEWRATRTRPIGRRAGADDAAEK